MARRPHCRSTRSACDELGFVALAAAAVLLAGASACMRSRRPQLRRRNSARESAALDLTGQWVAIVNEDWRWRMVTPPHGDYASVPLNDEGRRVADLWEPSQDGAVRGVRGGRAHAHADALANRVGRRRRARDRDGRGPTDAAADASSGVAHRARARCRAQSAAEWVRPLPPPGGPGLAGAGGGQQRAGRLSQGDHDESSAGLAAPQRCAVQRGRRAHRVFRSLPAPNGDEWLMVTAIVEDPKYLNTRFVTSSHFRREPDGTARWNPQPCRAS